MKKTSFSIALLIILYIPIFNMTVCTQSVHATNAKAEALYRSAQGHKENFRTKQDALKEINQALALDPKNSSYLSMKALIILMVEEDGDDQALKYANDAIKYGANNPDAWNLKAQIYVRRKNYQEALKAANEAVKFGQNHEMYRTTRAEVNARFGHKAEAIKELDEIIKTNKTSPGSLALRASIAESDKDWVKSIELRTYLIGLTGKTSISMIEHYSKRAEAYEALKQYDKAIADLNAVNKISTLNHGIHYKLLKLYKMKNDQAGVMRETNIIKSMEEDMRPL